MEKILKLLQIRNCILFPRFNTQVSEELDQNAPSVVELRVKLTKSMALIQQSILDCLEICLSEVKRCKLLIDVEDELNIEFAISKTFVPWLRSKLKSFWHKVGFKTSQAIDDLVKLRNLLEFLIQYDSITFLKVLHLVIMSSNLSSSPSNWVLSDSANALMIAAQSRVYIKKERDGSQEIVPTLEEQPKWKQIKQLIGEIELEIAHNPNKSGDSIKVLILGEDPQACKQIESYLEDYEVGPDEAHPMLKSRYDQFWLWKEATSNLKQNIAKSGGSSCVTAPPQTVSRPPPANKRRRVRGSSQAVTAPNTTTVKHEFDDIESEVSGKPIDLTQEEEPSIDLTVEDSEEDIVLKGLTEDFGVLTGSPNTVELIIKPLQSETNESDILTKLQPQYIILTVPHPSFIRQVEVYQSLNPELNIKLFFLVYRDSFEEQNFLLQIRKEKESFEKLILDKANMVVPHQAPGGAAATSEYLINLSEQATRIAGGQKNTLKSVIVDMREFRSMLPSALHQKGFKIIPSTLVVGDYILSPDHCVERKSLPDLIQSISSGRLYGQVEAMSQYYKYPILLIEFDEAKAFTLESMGGDPRFPVSDNSIKTKLVLLTLTFPKLKIIWSSSNQMSTQYFDDIKKEYPEPDLETSTNIGAVGGGDTHGYKVEDVGHDILLSLPGINYQNIIKVKAKVNSLRELSKLNLSEMIELLDSKVNGTKLNSFFNLNFNNLPK